MIRKCARGHEFSEENTYRPPSGGRVCRACKKMAMAKFAERHPGYFTEWQRLNSKSAWREAYKISYKMSGRQRDADYRRIYGITLEKFNRMMVAQGGVCAVCGATPTKLKGRVRNLVVDHDHATGIVRGLLCVSCNAHLGWFERRASAVGSYLNAKVVLEVA